MKKLFLCLLCVLLIPFSQLSVFAHSGRTDSSGGHRDNQNKSGLGSYHYHCGGNPPHLHDGGGCPYSSDYTPPTPAPPDYPDYVEVSGEKSELTVGESMQVSAAISPENAQNTDISWSSDDTSVAEIDKSGNISAKKPGTVTFTATSDGGAYASLTVTILGIPVESISFKKNRLNIPVGGKFPLEYAVNPSNATNQKVEVTIKDKKIAAEKNGDLIALKPGKTTVTVKSQDGPAASCTVTVLPIPVDNFEMKAPDIIRQGDTVEVSFTALPKNATKPDFTFKSTTKDIADFDNSGKLVAKEPGTANIQVVNADYTKDFQIKILPPLPENISIISQPESINLDENMELGADITPKNSDEADITWAVDNSEVAKIQGDKLIPIAAGIVTVTATTANGKQDSFTVEIENNSSVTVIVIIVIVSSALLIGVIVLVRKKFLGGRSQT